MNASLEATLMGRARRGFDAVRAPGLVLPGVEEGTAYGAPALKVQGKMFACMTSHRSAEPNTLAVRVSFDTRDQLLAAEPETYYLTDHYVDHPCVLVRLSEIRDDALRDLLLTGWRFVSGGKISRPPRTGGTPKRPRRRRT